MMRSRFRSTAAKKISFRVAMLICRGGSEGSLWNCLPALYWFLLVLGNVKGWGRAVLLCFAARRPRPVRRDGSNYGWTAVRRVYPRGRVAVCWLDTPVGGIQMKKISASLSVAALLLAGTLVTKTPAFAQSKEGSSMPKVGDMAPDFSLKYSDGKDLKEVKLSDYRGKKNVVLAFYVFAFTGG